MYKIIIFFGCGIFLLGSCTNNSDKNKLHAYTVKLPIGLPTMPISTVNPTTSEGVALGKKLFYDPILSDNNLQACGSCHQFQHYFTDSNKQFSSGIDGVLGKRNAIALFNLAYAKQFMWDGGAADLESQVLIPLRSPIEMHSNLTDVLHKLNSNAVYQKQFKSVFNQDSITTSQLLKALAQFERSIVSGNSKFDNYMARSLDLTIDEQNGFQLFKNPKKGNCVSCHKLNGLFTDFAYKNNGLDAVFIDKGRYLISLNDSDMGKFKTPTLRNIALTYPYMHDGRFSTLDQVLKHYNANFKKTKYTDTAIKNLPYNRLSSTEIMQLKAFLLTLTDNNFITHTEYAKP